MMGKRWNAKLVLAACLGVIAAVSLFAEEPAQAVAGSTVRITPPDRIEIPGVATLAPGSVKGSFVRVDDGQTVSVRVDEKLLHVPMPRTRPTGKLIAVDEKTITVLWRDETRVIPREAIATLEVRHDRRGDGPALGVMAGVAAGVLTGVAIGKDSFEDLGLAVLLAIPGAFAGGALASSGRNDWEVVAIDDVKLVVAPRRGGASARLSWSF